LKKKLLTMFLIFILLFNVIQIPTFAVSNEQSIYDFLTKTMNFNSAAACGVLANIQCESGFISDIIEHGYSWEQGGGYGICQWTNYPRLAANGRRTELLTFCASNGYDYKSLTGQLWYLKHELETSNKTTLYKIKNAANDAQGAYQAGYDWCYFFEIPANFANVSVTRGNLSKTKYWPKYSSVTTTNPPKTSPPAGSPTPIPTPPPTPKPVFVISVSLNSAAVTLNSSNSYQLVYRIYPSNATNKKVTWKTSDDKVAVVSATGKITAKARGTAVVSVTTSSGVKQALCKVTVNQLVTGVKLSKSVLTIKKGRTHRLTPTVLPAGAFDKRTIWMSTNLKVAYVSSAGVVKALSKGVSFIYVTTAQGRKNANCKVVVK